jgi:hypothetical protein
MYEINFDSLKRFMDSATENQETGQTGNILSKSLLLVNAHSKVLIRWADCVCLCRP